MNIPGLFIEYLLSGGVACLWLVPLLIVLFPNIFSGLDKQLIMLLGIPFLYAIGMALDMLSAFIVRKTGVKKKLRKQVKGLFVQKYGDAFDEKLATVYLWLKNPDLGKEYEKKSSRDRVARTTVINLALAAVVLPYTTFATYAGIASISLLLILALLSGIFFQIWKVCERRSYFFKIRAVHLLSKHESDR